jgi:hypothetical protein
MQSKIISALILGLVLLAAPRHANAQTADTTKSSQFIGWAGLGIWTFGVTIDTPFGSFSRSTTDLGLHVGGAANLVPLAPDLPLIIWGEIPMVFSGKTYFPLAAGAGVRYDKAGPLQILGGLGLAIAANTGSSSTPVGVRIMGMVLYPLTQVNPNLSIQTQLSWDILSQSAHIFPRWTAGIGWAF